MKYIVACLLGCFWGICSCLLAKETTWQSPLLIGSDLSVAEALPSDSLSLQWEEWLDSIALEELTGTEAIKDSVTPDRSAYFTNPFASTYFFAPSAIPLRKGEGYYQNILVGINGARYGLTDQISITAGLEAFTALYSIFGNDTRILTGFAGINWSTQLSERWWVGGGVMGAAADRFEQLAVAYGMATYGSLDHHVSFGIGLSGAKDRFIGQPILTLAATRRLSLRWALVTENWVQGQQKAHGPIIPTQERIVDRELHLFLSGGARYMQPRFAIEAGLVAYGVMGDGRIEGTNELLDSYTDWLPVPVPYASLAIKLGK
ncbi:MAG: hypothetical protein AAF399_23310 [Bacteroidota bacterium]